MKIPSETAERLRTMVTTTLDPTSDPPEWAFITKAYPAAAPDTGDWEAGTWVSSWSASTERVEAATPIVGGVGSGATVELTEGKYHVWIRWTVNDEVPVRLVDELVVV